MTEIIYIILGLSGLWLGTKWIMNGALAVANRFNLSHTFVGLGILAIGTDLPEVFVSINASFMNLRGTESSGIITGNAIGSCISQITLILGLSGMFMTFMLPKKELFRNGIFLLSSLFLFWLLSLDGLINRLEGIFMILTYVVFYFFLLKNSSEKSETSSIDVKYSFPLIAAFLIGGLALLLFASRLVVENAILLAEKWNVAQTFIGITIIGLGTSLPELAVSLGAAFRKSAGMSVGNILGSNIFDGLIPVGIGGLISTTTVSRGILFYDLPLLFAISFAILLLLGTQRGISRSTAIVLIFLYAVYVFLKI